MVDPIKKHDNWELHGNAVPEGHRWVCMACGKSSRDVYGRHPYNYGWDESCSMNATLLPESRLLFSSDGGRVLSVRD